MKSAFAKLLEKNPVQSSHDAFRAGGNGVPILTRASSQSTAGYQTMGLPDGSHPMPGGGANKTVLGAYRMGDQDGNAPSSAIYPGDIFGPIPLNDRVYPEVTFSTTGNNVAQPDDKGKATLALLKRLGDQQFKAKMQAPFEDYMVEDRIAKTLQEASRGAGLEDAGKSREILRSLVDERRQQSEADYLRRMLSAGMTPEGAQKEIENVRNANALQEAKKVDDRAYQAKTLISRLAQSRGITPSVQEPLTQGGAIRSPQGSQAMASLAGRDGEGFGTTPQDVNRQSITPEFYSRYLRRSTQTQESADEQTAFSNLLTNEKIPQPTSGSYSLATLQGQERQNEIEGQAEMLASRLESLRLRQNKIKLPLAEPIFAKELVKRVYTQRNKKADDTVLTIPENIQDMSPSQLILSINYNLSATPNGLTRLKKELGNHRWGTGMNPSETWIQSLKQVAYKMNQDNFISDIPSFPVTGFSTKDIIDSILAIRNDSSTELKLEVDSARESLKSALSGESKPARVPREAGAGADTGGLESIPATAPPAPPAPPKERKRYKLKKRERTEDIAPPPPVAEPPYESMTIAELKSLLRTLGMRTSGNKPDLIKRLRGEK